MAAAKPPKPTTLKPKPVRKPKPKTKTFKPSDFLRGSTNVGKNYTAWSNYGQKKPDFGKGSGPGTPYHEVQRRNTGRNSPSSIIRPPVGAQGPTYKRPRYKAVTEDPRTSAIRRRLGWK